MESGGVSQEQAILAVLDTLDTAWAELAALPVSALDAPAALSVLNRLEVMRRRQPTTEHAVLTQLQTQTTPIELGTRTWRGVLSGVLGISDADATRRLGEAAQLGARRTVTGEPLAPQLPATAAAQARGEIGAEHVTILRDFHAHLPTDIDPDTRAHAETQLADLAGGLTPRGLRQVARQLMGYLDPDGTLDDERLHTRKRGLHLGPQDLDGMSRLTGWIDPELRAALDAILAKLAGPGFCNPDDDHPCLRGTPTQDQIAADDRTHAQRTHDAIKTVCEQILASGKLGQHNGLPVIIVATATLADLSAGTGHAHTSGGTTMPIPTMLRRAADIHPYLLLLGENPRKIELYYGRTRRTASAGQRLALHVLERGCTKPACTRPANHCQVHHATCDWQHGGTTNIDDLTLACGSDNRLVNTGPTGWKTRKRKNDNRTEWTPPAHLNRGQPRTNLFHHPEEVLRPDEEPDDAEPG